MHKGLLFNEYFLTEGVKDAREWGEVTNDDVRAFRAEAAKLLDEFNGNNGLARPKHDERDTVDNFIIPVLEEERLGWERGLRHAEKQTSHGNKPDLLLFTDKEDARTRSPKHAAVIVENKRWNLPLDRRESESAKGATTLQSAPSSQILRYLRDIEEGAEWGVLTNGAQWRLYYRRANSKSEHFLELNLEDIVRKGDEHWLRVFILMFRRESFVRGAQGTFHERAREKSRDWEQRITEGLSTEIFEKVFPRLARALAKGEKNPDEARLRQIGHDTMILLFRLLFVLYAEDRELLPVTTRRYKRYALLRTRDDLRDEDPEEYSGISGDIFGRFRNLCRAINAGDKALRLPPYNGGLFDPKRAPLLEKSGIADCEFAFAVKTLSYREEMGEDKRINYRDLSVQHLGAMYERFLEQELKVSGGGKGQIHAKPNRYARKSGGSYYTPEELVQLVIGNSVGILLKEYKDEFNRAVEKKASVVELRKLDTATRGLKMKVCDPAMGSGHFLVSLVDYLADWALAEIVATENAVAGYRSPLLEEIKTVRGRIEEEAGKGGWEIDERHLDDRQIIRRIVLKRVVYGADKNLMAVELAKLSLWLHTFTVGAPLTFLDHHLRHGDSLFGEFAIGAMESLKQLGTPLGAKSLLGTAQKAAEDMLKIESVTDSNIAEVQSSIAAFSAMQGKSAKFNRTMSLLHCRHWFAAEDGEMQHINALNAVEAVLQDKKLSKGGAEFAARAEALCKRENFIHWETAFPGVWSDWESEQKRQGGFDAIIGNPPWARMRVLEVDWFNVRDPSINEVEKRDERKNKIQVRRAQGDPLIAEYDDVVHQANTAITVAQQCGAYSYIPKSNINLYLLFVERVMSLMAPKGVSGLLVPSEIFSGLSASDFFRNIANNGRLAVMLDFINSPHHYFKDVHNSFKFCVFAFGGAARQFSQTECMFLINKKKNKGERVAFAPGDFDVINPNTGNAPASRTQRGINIMLGMHRNFPILQKDGDMSDWPVRQLKMLDRSGDSGKLNTAAKLTGKGCYPVKPNHYKDGDALYHPLYIGRMLDHYNHRANSTIRNPANPLRQLNSKPSTLEQLQSPSFCPEPPFWVAEEQVKAHKSLTWFLGYRDVTAATNKRTVIPALVPRAAYDNTLPLIMPALPPEPKKPTHSALDEWRNRCASVIAEYKENAPLLAANLSSFALDFVAREKNADIHTDWHFLQQLPIIPPGTYKQEAGKETVGDFVRGRVLRLVYTSNDMAPFARDMGCKDKPFSWDEEKRAYLRAQLDAMYLLLYGITDDDAEYILNTFPIVKKRDEKKHHGYFTRDLILRYLRAYRAGDWAPDIIPPSYQEPKPEPKPKATAKAKKKPKKKKG